MNVSDYKEYSERERERRLRLRQEFNEGNIDIEDIPEKLNLDLRTPVTRFNPLFGHSYHEQITLWNVLPFYEQVILPLQANPDEDAFERAHGFGIDEINDVVELAEQDRIQLILKANPETYIDKGMDFVAELLELEPPVEIRGTLLETSRLLATQPETLQDGWDELTETFHALPHIETRTPEEYLSAWKHSYSLLQCKYPSVADSLLDEIQRNPNTGLYSLDIASSFLLDSPLDPFADTASYPRNMIPSLAATHNLPNIDRDLIEFPGEIGHQLMNQTAPDSPDRWTALTLSDEFESHNLRQYMKELNETITTEENPDIGDTIEEIEAIIASTRSDLHSLQRHQKVARGGVRVSFCAMGTAIGSITGDPVGTVAGFLASLGISYAEDKVGDSISKRLIAMNSPYSLTTFKVEESLSAETSE